MGEQGLQLREREAEGPGRPGPRAGEVLGRDRGLGGQSCLPHSPTSDIPGRLARSPLSPHRPGISLSGFEARLQYAPIEYTRQALELVASVTKMVQKSMNLLSLYKISIPDTLDVPARAAAGPSVPPSAVERERWEALTRSRGRARGTYDESGPSEPVLDDDDDETSEDEEAASP